MEIWTDISLQLLTVLGWAGTGYTNLPNVALKHQCPPGEQPAFPQASGSSGGQVSGVWKRPTEGMLKTVPEPLPAAPPGVQLVLLGPWHLDGGSHCPS